jgi:hypothetical protein
MDSNGERRLSCNWKYGCVLVEDLIREGKT